MFISDVEQARPDSNRDERAEESNTGLIPRGSAAKVAFSLAV
jgi:hypothetical protein